MFRDKLLNRCFLISLFVNAGLVLLVGNSRVFRHDAAADPFQAQPVSVFRPDPALKARPAAPKREPRPTPPAPAARPAARRVKAASSQIGRPGPGTRGFGRKPGSDAGQPSRARTPLRQVGSPRLRETAPEKPELTGGGSPAPSRILAGKGGAPGPITPPEDIIFSGGGAGGENLPIAAPDVGGGGAQDALTEKNPQPRASGLEARTGLGPGQGGGQGADDGKGVGFAPGNGIGTRPDGEHDRATLKRAPGDGVGAGEGANLGTRAPGGGKGTGSELPGTGGTGRGYGRGDGDDAGNGNGSGPRGAGTGDGGGGGRGAVFDVGGAGAAVSAMHIVYVMDVSLSMKEGDKMGKAKEALVNALKELKPVDTFNVIAFDGEVHPLSDSLMPATRDNIRRATAYVENIPMGEGTNLGDALMAAFSADTISQVWVLSDGEPTVGETNRRKLRRMVREKNRQKAQLITLALGLGEKFEGMSLLKDLAKENGGTFSYINLRGY